MSKRRDLFDKRIDLEDEGWVSSKEYISPLTSSGKYSEPKKMRKVNPLGMRVVVRLRKDANVTEAGLYLPEGAKESTQESFLGEVIEVARAMDDETTEEANISGLPLGALVLIPKKAGVTIPWDDELRIVETKDVLAIIHEVSFV